MTGEGCLTRPGGLHRPGEEPEHMPEVRTASVSGYVLRAALILAAVYALYWRTLKSYFLADDFHALVFSRSVLAMSSVEEVVLAFLTPVHGGAFLRPAGRLLWVADYALWGLNPFGYHLTNLGLHIVASLLVYLLTSRVARRRAIALLAALAFACHPLCVEPVAWLSARNDLLCACFYLGSLNAYASFSRSRKGAVLGLSLVLAACALLAKETAASLPAVIVLWEGMFGEPARARGTRRLWQKVKWSLPYVGVVGLYLVVRWAAVGGVGGYRQASGAPRFFQVDVDITLRGLARVLQLFLLPIRGSPLGLLGGVIPVAYLGVYGVYLLRAGLSWTWPRPRVRPWLAFGALWLLITAVAVHNLLLLPDDLRNSRYVYLPLVGLSMALAFAVGRVPGRPITRAVQIGFAAGVFLVFATLTWRHTAAWAEAGHASEAIMDQLQSLHPEPEDGTRLHFVGVPRSVGGAYVILGDTIESAVRIHYPSTAILTALNATPGSAPGLVVDPVKLELGTRDLVLEWDKSGHLADVTDVLRSILAGRSAAAEGNSPELPSWEFGDGRGTGGWQVSSGLEADSDGESGLVLRSATADPYLYSPAFELDPTTVDEIEVRMSALCSGRQEGVADLFWRTLDDPEFDDVKRIRIPVILDGVSRSYRFEQMRDLTWLLGGRVLGLRLDPIDCEGTVRLESVTIAGLGAH